MPVAGHTAIEITLNSTTVPAVDQWFGYSLYEVASTDIVPVVFRDGVSTGTILWAISHTSAGWTEGVVFPSPIEVPSGVLHIDTTGAVAGTVFV